MRPAALCARTHTLVQKRQPEPVIPIPIPIPISNSECAFIQTSKHIELLQCIGARIELSDVRRYRSVQKAPKCPQVQKNAESSWILAGIGARIWLLSAPRGRSVQRAPMPTSIYKSPTRCSTCEHLWAPCALLHLRVPLCSPHAPLDLYASG